MIYYSDERCALLQGDCLQSLKGLPAQSVHCCVTSPPYFGLRDYGVDGQIGLEPTPDEFVAKLVEVFREVKRVLRDDGTLWLNLGDSYAGSGKGSNPDGTPHPSKPFGKQGTNTGTVTGKNMPQKASAIGLKSKDLIGIPWRVAFALQADGWYLRQDIIWHKPNPMPESVRDRCTKAHEYIFLLSKREKYHFDSEAIKEPVADATVKRARANNNAGTRKDGGKATDQCGLTPERHDSYYENLSPDSLRNKRSVWTVTTKPFKGAHFATFPPDLIEPCILAGCPAGGFVLDPFNGAGTTGLVAMKHGRKYVGCELNPEYCDITVRRLSK